MYWKILLVALAALAGGSFVAQAEAPASKRPLTFDDLMAMQRVGEPIPSPDGKWVAFESVEINLGENAKRTHLWIVPAAGGDAHRLNPDSDHDESRPRFSPDGRRLMFSAKAGEAPQIWMAGFDPETGTLSERPHQVTKLSTGADGAIWSPDGKRVVFVSEVYPDAKNDVANKARDEALQKSKVKAQLFTHLFYRHWNAYTQFKRRHLFVVAADTDYTPTGETGGRFIKAPQDLTPGDHDVPPFSLGGQDMYAVSPDGQELAYTSNIDEVEAISTNNEIFVVPMAGGTPKKISVSPGSDATPLYSPDGKWIAWRSQARAGYESDKEALVLYDRQSGELRNATADFDRSVESIVWGADSQAIFFTVEEHGQSPIYALSLKGLVGGHPTKLAAIHAGDLAFGPDGKNMFFSQTTISAPSEIASVDVSSWWADGSEGLCKVSLVTHVNAALLSQLDLPPLESFTFKGAEDADVQGFLLKPPGFDPGKKYPVKFLIHGGPQGAWSDSWSYRWNPELMAASGGYVVVMVNPHGSTGYGQAFTDGVNGDWGGKPYVDLMKGLDYAEQTYPFIDKDREAALGASYGGYMINWILGHTDRFKCLVSHDGMFNTAAAYGSTEELWFNEWEFKGTPWDNPETYQQWSPDQFAKNFKTPTLVIHGQLDYRLDVSQGFALFTTLQRLKVPSEMLYFPDEGHWVLKPQNSQLWNKTVSDWVDRWTAR